MSSDIKTQALLLGLPSSNLWARVCRTLKIKSIQDLGSVSDEMLLSVVGVRIRDVKTMREFFAKK